MQSFNMSVPDEGYSSHMLTLSVPDEGYSRNVLTLSVPDEGYSSHVLTLSVPDEGYSSHVLTLSEPDEGYSRNVSCALNLISRILFMLHKHTEGLLNSYSVNCQLNRHVHCELTFTFTCRTISST